jgi:hypothetical protein
MKTLATAAAVVAAFGAGTAMAWLGDGTPRAWAQGAGAPDAKHSMILATGGSTANTNDIAWVLTTDLYEDPKTKDRIERRILLCYKVAANGTFTDIVDIRDITWDAKYKQLPVGNHNRNFSPDEMRKQWEKAKREAEEEAKRNNRGQ